MTKGLESKKVLIVRFSSIGDIVVTSPVVRCIKKQMNAEVHFLTFTKHKSLVATNPHIDQCWSIYKDIDEVFDKLKEVKFDLVVDLHKSLRSRLLTKRLDIKKITFNKLNVKKWIYTTFQYDLLPDKHIVDRYFEALHPIGVTNDGKGLDFFIDSLVAVPSKVNLPEQYQVLVLGATYHTKRIPNDVALKIINKSAYPVVLIGGRDVEAQALSLEEQDDVINLVGNCTIQESALVIKQSERVYSGDTGMMHIAAALKKPLTVIWGNTTPKLGLSPYFGDHPVKADLVNHEVSIGCRPCSKLGHDKCPKGHFKCMLDQDI